MEFDEAAAFFVVLDYVFRVCSFDNKNERNFDMITYSKFDLLLYLLLYAFLAWVVEVCWYSVKDKQFHLIASFVSRLLVRRGI